MTKREEKIANAYHNSAASLKEIAREFQTSPSYVAHISKRYERKQFLKQDPPRPKEMAVIKVEPKWIAGIVQLLESRGIPCEVPERFELIEYYESKLNNQ